MFFQKKKLWSWQKKLKAYDLSSLSEFLPELKTLWQPSPAAQFKLNCKSMQKLMGVLEFLLQALDFLCIALFVSCNTGFIVISLKEWKQLSTVLNHPAFQLDSLAAILQHLHSTQPVTDEKPKKTKMEGRRKKQRNVRLQMDLNLWLCDLKDKFLSICFYEPYLFISDPLMPTFWIRDIFTWLTSLSGFVCFLFPRDAL